MTTARISKILKTAIPMTIACALFASGCSAMAQSATAQSHEGHCSNRTLSGEYGCSVQGFLLNIPGLPPEATSWEWPHLLSMAKVMSPELST